MLFTIKILYNTINKIIFKVKVILIILKDILQTLSRWKLYYNILNYYATILKDIFEANRPFCASRNPFTVKLTTFSFVWRVSGSNRFLLMLYLLVEDLGRQRA